MPNESITVVLVDDHQMFAQLMQQALDRESDIEVLGVAATVDEAVSVVNKFQPQVVLMDYSIPGGNGVKATELIKHDQPQTKVVLVTGFDEESVLVSAIEAGCSGFVTKQKAIDEVVSAVRAAAAGEALISPSMLARLLRKLRKDYRGVGQDLTPREVEVLRLLAAGMSNQAIADQLVISLHTVRNHVQNILSKLQAHSKLEAVAVATREGII